MKATFLAAALSVTWLFSTSPANAAGRSEAISADVSEKLNATSVKAKLIEKLGADALWITVSVSGETAILTGEVPKLPRRELVEQLALSVKGIRKVDNQVTVGANGKGCPTRHPKEDTTAAGPATF